MTLVAYNQVPIPSFMYGTAWKKAATKHLVELAVASGFKAIDTANQLIHYQEALVGEALQALEQKGIERDTLFLQTKFTYQHGQDYRLPYDPDCDLTTQVRQSIASSLKHLGVTRIDSYILHGPSRSSGLGQADWETWRSMEDAVDEGLIGLLGISNVSVEQLRGSMSQEAMPDTAHFVRNNYLKVLESYTQTTINDGRRQILKLS